MYYIINWYENETTWIRLFSILKYNYIEKRRGGRPMEVHGLVAEYNPFHNGHKYMVDCLREQGATHIVAVMSGNFVQRGSVAIMDKRARARAAINGGVDLLLELPVPWAVSSAEFFASGGVSVLDSLGCVDKFRFGTENDDIDLLLKAKDAVLDPTVDDELVKSLRGGISYPVAREGAVRKFYGDQVADVLKGPNNILGIEYLKALDRCNSTMNPLPLLRKGVHHDHLKETGEFASASSLRIKMEREDERMRLYMPETTVDEFERQKAIGRAPVRVEDSQRAILSRLRMMTVDDIRKAPDVSEGLEYRIYNAIQAATSIEELYDIIKTKRYTRSRIRRIIIGLYLGIGPSDRKEMPYIRVLGMNDKGREILRVAKDTATLPVVMKASQFINLPENGKHVFELEQRATNLYNLAGPRILPCGTELTDEIIFL